MLNDATIVAQTPIPRKDMVLDTMSVQCDRLDGRLLSDLDARRRRAAACCQYAQRNAVGMACDATVAEERP
ncbi:hypothetical protein PI125_g19110 [Phytophthora idaei]|nr:hypothetical protein PI125_g19110 [Phytophthora idaei]